MRSHLAASTTPRDVWYDEGNAPGLGERLHVLAEGHGHASPLGIASVPYVLLGEFDFVGLQNRSVFVLEGPSSVVFLVADVLFGLIAIFGAYGKHAVTALPVKSVGLGRVTTVRGSWC